MGHPRRASSGHHWTSQGQTATEGGLPRAQTGACISLCRLCSPLAPLSLLKRLGAFPAIHCWQTRDPPTPTPARRAGVHLTPSRVSSWWVSDSQGLAFCPLWGTEKSSGILMTLVGRRRGAGSSATPRPDSMAMAKVSVLHQSAHGPRGTEGALKGAARRKCRFCARTCCGSAPGPTGVSGSPRPTH